MSKLDTLLSEIKAQGASFNLKRIDLSEHEPPLTLGDIKKLVNAIQSTKSDLLEELVLDSNEIDDDGVAELAQLASVKRLYLAGNKEITQKGVISLAHGPAKYASLSLSNNQINDEGFEVALGIDSLRSLSIGLNYITDAFALKMLSAGKLDKLDGIFLSGNDIEENTLKEIQSYMKRDRTLKRESEAKQSTVASGVDLNQRKKDKAFNFSLKTLRVKNSDKEHPDLESSSPEEEAKVNVSRAELKPPL